MDIRADAHWAWLEFVIGALLIGVAVVEIVISSSPFQRAEQGLSVEVTSTSLTDKASSFHLMVSHGSPKQPLDLAAFALGKRPVRQLSVYVYEDSRFPVADVAPTVPQGIFDHLSGELATRHYEASVAAVSAEDLARVLKDTTTAAGRVAVMMTGVIPANVFSSNVDLLTPWVQAGGLAVWGGGAIGFWSGENGQSLSTDDALGDAGTQRLLGSNVVEFPTTFGSRGDVESAFASALDLNYNFTGAGVFLDAIAAHGGLDLGWDSAQVTSVAYLPRGLGGFLIFGGEIPDEASVSVDLARILMSGAIYGTGQAASRHLTLSGSAAGQTVDWALPFPTPTSGLMLVAFDPSPDALYFYRRQIKR